MRFFRIMPIGATAEDGRRSPHMMSSVGLDAGPQVRRWYEVTPTSPNESSDRLVDAIVAWVRSTRFDNG